MDGREIGEPPQDARSVPFRQGYEPALDGIRGLAILLVVGSHLGVLRGGYIGVDLFFGLSGYLITRILLEDPGIFALYVRRAGRLVPALASVLLICFVAAVAMHDGATLLGVAAGATYSSNVLLGLGFNLGATGALWSLATEEQFYLMWPVVLVVFLRGDRAQARRLLLVVFMTVVASRALMAFGGASHLLLYFLLHWDALVLGCLAAVSMSAARTTLHRSRIALCAILALAGTLPASLGPFGDVFLMPLVAFLSVVVVLGTPPHDQLFASRTLTWFGTRSYGIYLYHTVFIAEAGKVWWLSLAAVAAAILMAAVSYRYLETPIRSAVRRRVAQSRRALSTAMPVAAD